MYWSANEATKNLVWRFAFPAVGASLFIMWGSKEVVRLLIRWRLVVRDEVYLIGERLHNFGERKAPVVQQPVVSLRSEEQTATAAAAGQVEQGGVSGGVSGGNANGAVLGQQQQQQQQASRAGAGERRHVTGEIGRGELVFL